MSNFDPKAEGLRKRRVLFQLSGSIAAYKACGAISRLVRTGYEVQTVATANALKFVGAATLEGLTGRPALFDAYEPGKAMKHIDAIRWADAVILCPASANAINKLASGIGDDLVSTLFLAHDFNKPYLIAPAMNSRMHEHPTTQASIARLRSWGVELLETGSGALACGEVGFGRLLEPDEIVAAIERALTASDRQPSAAAKPLRVLVTAGGTREALDSVRALTNFSSGRTGSAIAAWLVQRGHRVTLLRASEASAANGDAGRSQAISGPGERASIELRARSFVSFADLARELRSELASADAYDAVVHAAAVGDYAIASIEAESGAPVPIGFGKADSSGGLTLRLKRNPKLLSQLRSFAKGRPLQVVAFKLTSGAPAEARALAVRKLLEESSPDFVVQNDMTEIEGESHTAAIFDGAGALAATCASKRELAQTIERLIVEGAGAPKAAREKEANP